MYKYRTSDNVQSFDLLEILRRARADFELMGKPVFIEMRWIENNEKTINPWQTIWRIT